MANRALPMNYSDKKIKSHQHNVPRRSSGVIEVVDYLKSFKSLSGVGPLYAIDGENIIIHEKSNIVSVRHIKLHKQIIVATD